MIVARRESVERLSLECRVSTSKVDTRHSTWPYTDSVFNSSRGIDGRIVLVQHGHSDANATVHHRVNTTSNVSSTQHFTGCGCLVNHITGCGCLVNPIRLSNTVERIEDSQEE
ncbi:hypothetical protein DPMN_052508 [Dreissena polymorpha]|uniref:Uncharacterized protein n=1 Tax=Dreissena polymorpha TaxID=45954 RepID=A0A9D4HPY1_DREPO|nr:hypothetical protein DPMN_052508 [Dreissena polymorpha]